jgi:Raf kinase inhibitor-like YbhB/YbcL family protein
MTLSSSAFTNGGDIPMKHSGEGSNVSPALGWSAGPPGTQSYAIVMRDLSLQPPTHYHWIIYDIPASTISLPEGIEKTAAPASVPGAKQTFWSFGAAYGYFGPYPPPADPAHSYEVAVFAFATAQIGFDGTDPHQAYQAILSKKTATATLTGKYDR